MGALRMMLAICVCIFHANSEGATLFLSGGAAVYIFFVISGYYMQMVLESKYSRAKLGDGWVKSFYLARYLRLFPAYALSCLIVLGVFVLGTSDHDALTKPLRHGIELFHEGGVKQFLYGLFILLSDLTMLGLNVPSVSDILVPPSWTLGIELSFYVLAPFLLNQSNRVLTSTLLLGMAMRLIPYNTHAPILAGIDMFCLGALVYRGRDALTFVDAVFRKLKPVGVFALLALMVTFTLPRWDFLGIPKTHNEMDVLIYPFLFALLIPSLFRMTANSVVDRFVGELSYPFYIFHQLVVDALKEWASQPYMREGAILAVVATGLTVLAAMTFYLLESRFIEPFRAKLSSPIPAKSKVAKSAGQSGGTISVDVDVDVDEAAHASARSSARHVA